MQFGHAIAENQRDPAEDRPGSHGADSFALIPAAIVSGTARFSADDRSIRLQAVIGRLISGLCSLRPPRRSPAALVRHQPRSV